MDGRADPSLVAGSTVALELSDRVAAGGDAIGHLADGRVVFVEGGLPGEAVDATLTQVKRDFAKARTQRVARPSADRITAPCLHRRRGCGGCGWQELVPDAQIRHKEAIVLDALRRIAVTTPGQVLPTVRLPTTAYRTTVHLAVDRDGRAGYRKRHETTPLAVDSCLVAHPLVAEILTRSTFPGHRAVSIRVGAAGGERLVVLQGPGTGRPQVPPGVEVVAPSANRFVHEDVGGRRWRVSARVFFQPGPAAAEALAATVDDAVGTALPEGGMLVDAYAGVGVLGGIVAGRRHARLVSIEEHSGAAADAAVNLAGIDVDVVTGEVGRWTPVPATVVIADPARSGLGRPGVRALSATGAGRLVLVSCDPASMARDAALLAEDGFRLEQIRLVDTFAQTPHVEVVSRFDR